MFISHKLIFYMKLSVLQGCHSVRKSQEKFLKMTKVRKKWGVLKKSQEKSGNLIKLKKKSQIFSV